MSNKSRNLLNLALLAVVAALLAVAVLKPGHKPAAEAPPLVRDDAKVQQVRIAPAGQPEVTLQRQGGAWRLLAPLDWPADAALMQSFVDTLGAPVRNRFPARGADLAKYGLDKPLAR